MLRILKIISASLGVLVALLVAGYTYLGGFGTVTIEEKLVGPFHFVYRPLAGPDFSKVGEITTALERDLRGKGFKALQPFDLFHPDGGGEIGFVIQQSDTVLFSSLDSTILLRNIPAQQCMMTTFPWKNSISYIIGFTKVDPALEEHRKKHGYRKTWAATMHDGDTIIYLQPIVKELLAPR